jgi:hypothetical protein
MTSAPVCDPLAEHLITPQNAALLLIDYQSAQLAGARRGTTGRPAQERLNVNDGCTHLDRIHEVTPASRGCVDCLLMDAGTGCRCGSVRNSVTSGAVTTLRTGMPQRASARQGTR